jgi:hypothetical protein
MQVSMPAKQVARKLDSARFWSGHDFTRRGGLKDFFRHTIRIRVRLQPHRKRLQRLNP